MQTPSVLCFYSKSADVAAGYGPGEHVNDPKNFHTLNAIHHWRRVLSNFHEHPFMWREKRWNSIEHAFQWAKLSMVDSQIAEVLCLDSGSSVCVDPALARRSRKLIILNADQLHAWNAISKSVMADISRAKFDQCELYRRVIRATAGDDGRENTMLMHVMRGNPSRVRFEHLEQLRRT